MSSLRMRSLLLLSIILFAARAMASDTTKVEKQILRADADNAGLKLQKGFGAVVVSPDAGHARHIAVSPSGEIYVKLERLKDGKGILVLHEDGNGKARVVQSFGNYGGTGIALKNGYLYASSNDEVFRYKLDANNRVIDTAHPEKIIK